MSDIHIRPAIENDQATIKQMVKDARLDPSSLHWSHFVVAEHGGQIVGIGQVRPYPKCRELGSLVVQEAFRKQGVGAQIVQALLAQEMGDVYLECLSHNEHYYGRFGFHTIRWWQAPMPLKLKSGIGSIVGRLFRVRLITMKRLKS